jgi:hypothetical protein
MGAMSLEVEPLARPAGVALAEDGLPSTVAKQRMETV